ncbi:hypothetical protein KDI_49130 [Dictyobacter arantiisoli]|uniref:Uncharacterized protein n=1 Tax=Dictyobacter arantiisoli TaxID=2014874 RepID=A0A5A5TJZ5_9CHLR|nr:hypothetical protein KDI_49130 [Dictyobacter arantiisoli]
MRANRILSLSIATLVITLIFFTSSTSNVHASSKPSVPHLEHCAVELVHLNGSNAPTVECLRPEKTAGQIIPNTYGTDCTSQALLLQAQDNNGTLQICFLGTGFINLTDYTWRFWPNTWNDRPTYYQSGCTRGIFYSDINGQGSTQNFGQYESGSLGTVQYTLSSFYIGQVAC